MAAIDWQNVHGCEFTGDEAREASDFVEVLRNFGLDAEGGWGLFEDHKNLSVGKRLVFAENIPIDKATALLFSDSDERIRGVISKRLEESRIEKDGGIILAG